MKNLLQLGVAALMTITSITINAQNRESENSILWEVTGNGLSKSSYITGTFHIMCSKDFEMKPKVLKALEKSESFVMEINYTDPKEMTALQKMFKSDRKLSDQLSPNEANELDKILTDYGTNLKNMDSSSSQALYALISMKAVPCPPFEIKSYELELMQIALKNKKKISGLEKVEDQLTSINKAYELKDVIQQLKMGKEYETLLQRMITAFKKEDLQTVNDLFKNDKFMNRKQEKAMLTDRNKNWAEKMPEMMEKESSLFAVGGAHLMGDNGIIKLLRAKGYTVKPLSNL
ncbi:MAG: TraB/GumN family protein [Chryseobacterium sp.]|uniref:TraB/GumN family protein n=1 Tax=Chryseobacterium sp. TaxID=1871047 RepID=UPI000DB5085E|nr:TraB/GumN family protein [Chryseobacterium sp.]MPS63591.1 TraB/GumN family protein [Chryseobacterium sp.]PZU13451.1 MAG: TraB/GumN family protein [Chryseobacterium sp.]